MPATVPKLCREVLRVCVARGLDALVFGLWWRFFNPHRSTKDVPTEVHSRETTGSPLMPSEGREKPMVTTPPPLGALGEKATEKEVSTGLAQQFENWSPGQIRTRFVVNLARARGEFDDKVTFAKTHLGSRSQDAAFLTTEVLGVGSFGEVKCVLHKDSGKEYALKTVVEGINGRAQVCAINEMLVLARLALQPHSHIICAEAMDDGRSTMPLLLPKASGSLFSLMQSESSSIKDQLRFLLDVAEGAMHMHGMGLIHKDINPGNVLIFKDEILGHHAKLADFGITKEAGATCAGLMGTSGFLPLECLVSENVTCHASQDVFAVAVLLLLVCAKSSMRRPNMFCHESLFNQKERKKMDLLSKMSDAWADIAFLKSKIAKRTMGDGSFLEVIVSNDFMDSALTVKKEVCEGLPFFLAAEWSERRDMASLKEFVESLEYEQLDLL